MARAVTPSGVGFQVRRHVLAWRPRFRWDLIADDFITIVPSILIGLVWLPIELLLDLLVSALLIIPRLLGLAGWRVTAVSDGRRIRMRWRVRGWGAAGQKVEQVRAELAAGADPSLHADKTNRSTNRRLTGGDGSDWTDDGGWDSGGDSGGGDGGGCGGGCGGGGD